LEKFRIGEMSDCEIVAFVERTAFGEDRGEEVVTVKSPDDKRFVVVLHPIGSSGGGVESNRSTNAKWDNCALAQQRKRSHVKGKVLILVCIESERVTFASDLSRKGSELLRTSRLQHAGMTEEVTSQRRSQCQRPQEQKEVSVTPSKEGVQYIASSFVLDSCWSLSRRKPGQE
jgi:hypothetical protein